MRVLLVALLCAAGCDDDTSLPAIVHDLSVGAFDFASAPDLSSRVDAGCTRQLFGGFAGLSDFERRVDCTCGCTIDAFEGNMVAGFWATPASTNTVFAPTSTGMQVALRRSGMTEFGTLASLAPIGPFYLDGDFDVSVEYRLTGDVPPDAQAMLALSTPTTTHSVERARLPDGSDVARALFAGVAPVAIPDSSTTGTIDFIRQGSTLEAIVDGVLVSKLTGAGTARLSLALTATLAACAPDAGDTCSFTMVWHNLKMIGGALVDRR
jgi:hypothetical protein